MLQASVSFRAQPHKRGEVLDAVDETAERMRRAKGCRRSRLFVDAEDANVFMLVSEWESTEDAEAFFDSRDFQIFKGIRILLREEPTMVLDDIQSRTTALIQSR